MAASPHPERSRRIRAQGTVPVAPSAGLDDAGFLPPVPEEKPHYLGHRQRLRERLLNAGAAALPDYELLEFLLTSAQARGDVKPLAKKLIDHFHGFAAVLAADRRAFAAVPGVGDAVIAALMAVREAGLRLARTELRERPVLGSWQKVIDYCTAHIGFAAVEEFHLLFLDRKNALIADERQQRGTIDHTPVYPREVVKRALDLGASALIMVHNRVKRKRGNFPRRIQTDGPRGKQVVSGAVVRPCLA